MYTYYHKHDGYSRRHENRLYEQDGNKAPSLLITRYTYAYTWQTRGVEGPRGGKARRQRAKYVFYRQGVFYRSKNVKLEGGKNVNSYEVFDGTIFDAYAISSQRQGVPIVTIELVEGVPVEVRQSGEVVWSYFDNTISELEDMLQIPEQDRAVVGDPIDEQVEQTTEEQTDIIAAAEAIVDAEAERIRWIESTTEIGGQISLFAYAGYAGDTQWQELAYAGGR